MSGRKDYLYTWLRVLRRRPGSVLEIRARLQNELAAREHRHGADSIEAEAAVGFLADYEEINARAIDDAIAREPARPVAVRVQESDFDIKEK